MPLLVPAVGVTLMPTILVELFKIELIIPSRLSCRADSGQRVNSPSSVR